MQRRRQSPRTWHATDAFALRMQIREEAMAVDAAKAAEVNSVKGDTARFFVEVCRLKPFTYQMELAELYRNNQFLAVRWPRQTGKSTSIGGLLLQDAYENKDLNIGFIGPSWRQTKLNIRRVASFCRSLPQQGLHVQKTRITLPNGSVIEAFPNNPDTIRGNTFHRIWWDETNFTSNDEDLYDAILFTLGTTNGKLIASSTPFNTDALFWKMCNHRDYSDFARHHFTWEKALAPNGPLSPEMIARIKRQFGDDPARWRREMEAEWAEDEDVWLAQSLIVSCVGTVKNCGEDLQEFNPEDSCEGEFFGGLDLAQTRDYCVFSVVERVNDRLLLRHLKVFQQPTKYAHVLGYIKAVQDRWGGFEKIRVDFTREGPSIISDMENAGINNAEGVNFSLPRKSEMASLLKQRMMDQRLFYPLLNWERPYRGDICTELNVERYELRKDGAVGFSHPNGTHDDVFWSIALSVYATVTMAPEPFLAILPRIAKRRI
ncbi:MAG: terminase family protein [Candidatus Bathyarchaeota archaeon]|nr:terminase family protein [Candidatus Bathyarchaeota archaeon]